MEISPNTVYLEISPNDLEISTIHLKISPIDLKISPNHLEISSNDLKISPNRHYLEISTIHLEISANQLQISAIQWINVKTARHRCELGLLLFVIGRCTHFDILNCICHLFCFKRLDRYALCHVSRKLLKGNAFISFSTSPFSFSKHCMSLLLWHFWK